MQRVFVRFLEEIEETKGTFRNYLTISSDSQHRFEPTHIPIHGQFRTDHVQSLHC